MIGMLIAAASSGSVLALDTFSRPNGALGKDEIGKPWVVIEGAMAISSQKAKGTTAGTSYAAIDGGNTNCVVSADITWYTGEIVALVARGTTGSSDNQMRARITGSVITISRRLSGADTVLATYNFAWTSGETHNIKLSCIGDVYVLYLDKVQILTATNNDTLLGNKYIGMLVNKSGSTPNATIKNLLATK